MNSCLQPGIDTTFYDNIYRAAKEVFHIQRETGLIEQASARLDIDEEINIAPRASFAPNDGAEQLDSADPVSFADGMDRIAVLSELFECVHGSDL
jgi:hypothetical protein